MLEPHFAATVDTDSVGTAETHFAATAGTDSAVEMDFAAAGSNFAAVGIQPAVVAIDFVAETDFAAAAIGFAAEKYSVAAAAIDSVVAVAADSADQFETIASVERHEVPAAVADAVVAGPAVLAVAAAVTGVFAAVAALLTYPVKE